MRKRIFNEQAKLNELIVLLRQGHAYSRIATHFDVDRSSILFQAKKLGLYKKGFASETTEELSPPVRKRCGMKYPPERINEGLETYADYVRAEERRKLSPLLKEETHL